MRDLIDRQEAIDALAKVAGVGNRALDVIRALPSAEPEIIRCKDCKKRVYCRTSSVWAVAPSDNWYCADAERRENGRFNQKARCD